jgi:hypothetical protein
VIYCSKECQVYHWKIHKKECKTLQKSLLGGEVADEPHDFEPETLSDLQELVSSTATPNGSVIKLKAGVYSWSSAEKATLPLVISRSVTIIGSGMTESTVTTTINCPIVIENNSAPQQSKSLLVLRNFRCLNGMKIKDNNHDSIELVNLHISLPDAAQKFQAQIPTREDCVEVAECNKLLVQSCEIFGGSDGLVLNGNSIKTHIKDSIIKYDSSRGIFANNLFTIEDSEVSCCGSYGMKTRSGCSRKGKCKIQAGPWDNVSPNF